MSNWVTVQPGLPDRFASVADTINSVVQALLVTLNLALAILNVIKAFSVGLLDPLAAILERIIDEIEGFLNDIRDMGIYIASDADLVEFPFDNILGGYVAYERRMIGRLVDRSDPTRPNFSRQTDVVGIFLYGSADALGLEQLNYMMNQILLFFGQVGKASSFPAPVNLLALYGEDGSNIRTYAPLPDALQVVRVPNSVAVTWRMPPPPGGASSKYASLMPKGFIIEVSVLREGLVLAYDTPAASGQPGTNNRVYGLVRDPKTKLPFRLFGGKALIDATDLEGASYESEDLTPQTRLFAYKSATDNVPIDISALEPQDGKAVLQTAFFVRAGTFPLAGPGQGYQARLPADLMPYNAEFEVGPGGKVIAVLDPEPATTVYIRVSAVTETYRDAVGATEQVTLIEGPGKNIWEIDSTTIQAKAQTTGQVVLGTRRGMYPAVKSEPSLPLTVTFPARDTLDYMDAVTTALVVMVLSRADLAVTLEDGFEVGKAYQPTGLEEIARFLMPRILGKKMDRYYSRDFISPDDFRSDLLRRCENLTQYLYNLTGPLGSVESTLVANSPNLLGFRWSNVDPTLPNQTILESLYSTDTSSGIGLNPYSIGVAGESSLQVLYRYSGVQVERRPVFGVKGNRGFYQKGEGSQDNSPVVYNRPNTTSLSVSFCRLVIPEEVYREAAAILNVASGPVSTKFLASGTGNWTALRMFPQSIPEVDAALQEVLGFADSITAGLNSVVDVILAYIEFLEARITEFQNLIIRINGLIQSAAQIDIPRTSALVVSGSGTNGVLSALVTSGNKPADSPLSYGAGVAIVAGGLPAILVEILQAFFPEEE